MTLLLVLALQALTALQVWCQDSEPGTASLGSSSLYSTRFQDVTWNNQEWSLTTTTIRPSDFRSVSFISNGYIGLSMASNGPFVQTFPESAGWPLFDQRQTFGTVSGFFDRQGSFNGTNFPWLSQYGWDSGISGIPAWGPLIVDLGNGVYLDANTSLSDISEVTLTQDFKQGIAEWQYTWTPASTDLAFNVSYTAFADKLHINRAYVRLRLTASKDCNVTIVNVLDGLNALRSIPIDKGSDGNFIYSAVNPVGVDNVTAWVFACAVASTATNFTESTAPKPYIKDASYSIAQEATIQVKAKVGITVTKFIGIASTDAFSNPRQHAKISAEAAMSDGYDKSFEAHKTEWAQVLPADGISNYSDPFTGQLPEIPAIIEKQIVSVVSVFALLMNTISQNAVMAVNNASVNINGISVGGLTSDAYAGQRFWDEDVWMQPYLAAVFPSAAMQISNNRVAQYPQAKQNVKTAYQSSKNETNFSAGSAIYPWTSGRDANCTATGPCFDYEYHLNGDIVKSFLNLWASTGDYDYMKQNLFDPIQSIATMFSELLQQNGSLYALTNLTDPDEYANHVDNGGFTMPLVANVLETANYFRELVGQSFIPHWETQALNVQTPASGEISLEYEGMNGTIEVKQADVVLKIYPFEVTQNYSLADQLADLDYYAGRQSANGPGMTYAIFSIDSSDVSPSGCSDYTYDQGSWSPYLREPWFLFSEQLIDNPTLNGGTNPAFPFLTGHGGALQVDLFGYLGLRYSTNMTLRVNPSLPPQIPYLKYPTFHFHGWPIAASANASFTTLTRLSSPLPNANSSYATNPIAVYLDPPAGNASILSLPPGDSLTIPNRAISKNKTVPGNILQCLHNITSDQPYEPGQFPLAAIDGSISTNWQPSLASAPAALTIDTSTIPFQPLIAFEFNWAAQPPKNATVLLSNSSSPPVTTSSGVIFVPVPHIAISNPYNASTANRVGPYQSNTTTVNLTGQTIWSGKWATLVVEGNANDDSAAAVGATVAEFALIGRK